MILAFIWCLCCSLLNRYYSLFIGKYVYDNTSPKKYKAQALGLCEADSVPMCGFPSLNIWWLQFLYTSHFECESFPLRIHLFRHTNVKWGWAYEGTLRWLQLCTALASLSSFNLIGRSLIWSHQSREKIQLGWPGASTLGWKEGTGFQGQPVLQRAIMSNNFRI